jgi:hypothetical protein
MRQLRMTENLYFMCLWKIIAQKKNHQSTEDCCICRSMSSSSPFSDIKHENDFQSILGCKRLVQEISAVPVVVLVKRWKKVTSRIKATTIIKLDSCRRCKAEVSLNYMATRGS